MKIVFNCSSCCVGWSIICAITLFLLSLAYFFELPMGEPFTKEEYFEMAKSTFFGGIVWIVAALFSVFMYFRGMKKAEKEKDKEDIDSSLKAGTSLSSSSLTEIK
ncbi:uncharacterized protein MONOS_17245 [Monocercomonoides exilis]|uniref:uncharacterized protein n=1 Tax=Monocercomonoides exilis TaxID=2049356 RepID=UPI003559CC9A|nr:hypothetical protein MONOS_17245 [Monocercomonoides exilis]